MNETPFLTPETAPDLVSPDCFLFSAKVALSSFQPESTPQALGIQIPKQVASASPGRKAEFVAGRFAAAVALRTAGYEGTEEVGIQKDRTPLWPAGFTGSITHTEGYVSAAVARQEKVRALGIDSEPQMSLEKAQKIGSRIAKPEELQLLQGAGLSLETAITLVFSAKESLFKALFPHFRRFFSFQDSEVTEFNLAQKTMFLSVRISDGESSPIPCRFQIADRIHTAIEIDARHHF